MALIYIACCVLHNFVRQHNNEDPLFDKYGLDEIMCEPDFDDEEDAPSTSCHRQNQAEFTTEDENVANKQSDQIRFQMFAQYNANCN